MERESTAGGAGARLAGLVVGGLAAVALIFWTTRGGEPASDRPAQTARGASSEFEIVERSWAGLEHTRREPSESVATPESRLSESTRDRLQNVDIFVGSVKR